MEYADPYHKRIEFRPESFRVDADGAGQRLVFVGPDEQKSITLLQRGARLVAVIAGENGEFVLWKIQLLGRPSWLTLDFEDNPQLRRIVVHMEKFSADDLDATLKELIGERPLLYFRRKPHDC